jgi:hypothetical protein
MSQQFEFEDIYLDANKIANKISKKYGNRYRGEALLTSDDFYSEMMMKLTKIIKEDRFTDRQHFLYNYHTACENVAKSLITHVKFTKKNGYVEDEDGCHRTQTISINESKNDDENDMTGIIESKSESSCLASLIENERFEEFCVFLDDNTVEEVLREWANPSEEFKVVLNKMLETSNKNPETTYHKALRKHLQLSSDLYRYCKDYIHAKVIVFFPEDAKRLMIC